MNLRDARASLRAKRVTVVALGLSIVSVLAACSPGDSGSGSGGGMVIAVQNDIRYTNNYEPGDSWTRLTLRSTIYDPLFETDADGDPAPALATSGTPSPDATSWTLNLRAEVLFHNGKQFTAEDVKRNFELLTDPATSGLSDDLANVSSVEVVDDVTAIVHLKSPDVYFPATITETVMMADVEASTPDLPIGTGPYMWDEHIPGDYASFVPFADHWRGTPPLQQVEFRVIPEGEVAALALESGEVDMMMSYIAPQSLEILRQRSDISIHQAESNTFVYGSTNFEKDRRGGYTDGAAVREGLSLFWNAQELVPVIANDIGSLATQTIPPWQLGHDPSIEPYPYDPVRGATLLAQGGIEKGDVITLLAWPFTCDYATAFGSEMESHGYRIELICGEGGEANVPYIRAYDWDLLMTRVSGRATAAAMWDQRYRSSLTIPEADDQWTLRDERMDEIIAAMKRATNEDEYVRLAAEAAQYKRSLYYEFPLWWLNIYVASGPRVNGFVLSPLGWYGILMNNMGTVTVD